MDTRKLKKTKAVDKNGKMRKTIKILINNEVIELEENLEAMRKVLITKVANELKDIGCDGVEAEEMAFEEIYLLSEDTIIKKIKQLEIK